MLPEPLSERYPGVTNFEVGIGRHWMPPVKPAAPANSQDPNDFIWSARFLQTIVDAVD